MVAPHVIEALTQRYIQAMTEQNAVEVPEDSKIVKSEGISGLARIFNAQSLFKRIVPQIESSDYYLLMVNGQQGSGKTVAARELAHYAHSAGYKKIYSSGFDISNAATEWARMANGAKKVCIVVDDTSHVLSTMSSKMQSTTKNWWAMIRHALQAQIFVIMITHVSTGVPPILRNSNVWLYSYPTMAEYDHMQKMTGRNDQSKMKLQKTFESIREIQEKALTTREISLNIKGRKYPFKWGDKHDPADGRLMLMIMNGEPLVYNSRNVFCDECADIGRNIKMNAVNYAPPTKEGEPTSNGGLSN